MALNESKRSHGFKSSDMDAISFGTYAPRTKTSLGFCLSICLVNNR